MTFCWLHVFISWTCLRYEPHRNMNVWIKISGNVIIHCHKVWDFHDAVSKMWCYFVISSFFLSHFYWFLFTNCLEYDLSSVTTFCAVLYSVLSIDWYRIFLCTANIIYIISHTHCYFCFIQAYCFCIPIDAFLIYNIIFNSLKQ